MKKSIYPLLAISMTLFAASCSQDTMLNDVSENDKTTISVQLPVEKGTRAVPNIPDGYQLRCKMQVVDAEGNAITGEEYKQTNTVPGSGSLTFTFTTPESEYKTLFWADYVPVSADFNNDYLYDTSDLTKGVTYTADKLTNGNLFNTEAADGFYGVGNDGENSIELKRPFTRLKFRANKAYEADYAAYDQVNVKMTVPSGINLLTGATTGTTSDITYQGATDKAGNCWFSNYVFTGNDIANLGKDFSFTLKTNDGSAADKTISVSGEQVPLTANEIHILNVKPGEAGKSDITVTFPGDMKDPDVLAVGQYIYKDGTHGTEYTQDAVAIVWKVTDGTAEGDSPANYTKEANGTDMTGKTIAGYAFAIGQTTRAYLGDNSTEFTVQKNSEDYKTETYNALTKSNGLIAVFDGMTSKLFTEFNTLSGQTAISANTSKWYIPTYKQANDFMTALMGQDDTTADPVIKAAFEKAGGDLKITATTYILSSTITGENKMPLVTVKFNEGAISKAFTEASIKKDSRAILKPVITIFK